MRPALRVVVVIVALLAAASVLLPREQLPEAGATGFVAPTDASRARSFTFDGVAPADRQAILRAIALARPEARRLAEAVAGLTTVRVGEAGVNAAGFTQTTAAGYDLQLDLAQVSSTLGSRGIARLVLHEVGHVVDFALVPPALAAQLDAGIPRGYGCDNGLQGGCAARTERFAESFAKWAMGDIGVALDLGYKVPPPTLPLDAWAAPLTRLR